MVRPFSSTPELAITKSLNIQGPGASQLTVGYLPATTNINPRIFQVAPNVNVALSGLTLSDGGGTALGIAAIGAHTPSPWDGYGGAILNFGGLTVSGCTLVRQLPP